MAKFNPNQYSSIKDTRMKTDISEAVRLQMANSKPQRAFNPLAKQYSRENPDQMGDANDL